MSQVLEGVSYKDLQKISSSFREVSSRLLRTSEEDGVDNLKRFIDFIETDAITHDFIVAKIAESGITFSETDLDTKTLPIDPAQEINFTYSKLKIFVESVKTTEIQYRQLSYFDLSWNYLCITGMPASSVIRSVNDEFNRRVVHPFINHIERYLRDLLVDKSNDMEGNIFNNLGTINNNSISGKNIKAVQGSDNKGAIGSGNRLEQNIINEIQNEVSISELLESIFKFQTLVASTDLPSNIKEEIDEDLLSATTAIEKKEPNGKRALERIQGVMKTIQDAGKATDAAQKLLTAGQPIVTALMEWVTGNLDR
jgi:hypothetical protein